LFEKREISRIIYIKKIIVRPKVEQQRIHSSE
jgi:hypothetical protein